MYMYMYICIYIYIYIYIHSLSTGSMWPTCSRSWCVLNKSRNSFTLFYTCLHFFTLLYTPYTPYTLLHFSGNPAKPSGRGGAPPPPGWEAKAYKTSKPPSGMF